MKRLPAIFVIMLVQTSAAIAGPTVVDISGEDFLINGQPTYSDIPGTSQLMHGLLFNVRAVNATFDDLSLGTGGLPAGFLDDNGQHANNNHAGYGAWDPDANTDRFIAALPSWRAKGVLGVTLNFQGGCSCVRHGEQGTTLAGDNQTPNNNPFGANGTPIHPDYLARMKRTIDALDANGMVCILGLFYFGQDQRISNANDSQALKNAVDAAVDWVLANDWRNVLIEVNNETTVGGYQHNILLPQRVHELFQRVKTRSTRPDQTRLFVSASSTGTALPPQAWMEQADFFLPHGNGLVAAQVAQLVADHRAHPAWQANPRPICFNEDSTTIANLNAAAGAGSSWGLYNDAHIQSVYPANWTIWSNENKSFFNRVADLVNLEGTSGTDKLWISAAGYEPKAFTGAMTTGTQYTSGSSSPPDADPDEDALMPSLLYVNNNADNAGDRVTYTVNFPSGGLWRAWGRFYYPGAIGSNDPNSFNISVDGGPERSFGNNRHGADAFREWHWDGHGEGEGPGALSLPLGTFNAGVHQVTIRNREADASIGPRLDVLLLTNDNGYIPNDADAAEALSKIIELDQGAVEQSVFIGRTIANDTFTIRNGGTGDLSYTINENANWLGVAPNAGVSSGETDTITLVYRNIEELPVAMHEAKVTVTAVGAANSPQTIDVSLNVMTVAPDLDLDGDVDQIDFGLFQRCLAGPGVPQPLLSCAKARLDDDEDVDQDDFGLWQLCMTGPNEFASPTCME